MHTKDNRKAAVEVFAHNEEEVTIICPHCSLDKDMNVEKVKDIAHWDIGAFCTRCKRKFNVSFNFREYFRKKVSLKGEISDVSNPETRIGDVIIEDISMKGIGFLWEGIPLQKGNVFILRFSLGDRAGTSIEKKIQVESVRENKVGANFVEEKDFDIVLGKYVLSE